MELYYEVVWRKVKYPRLEFKGLKLKVILPPRIKDARELIEKRKAWIERKWNIIQESIKRVGAPEGFMILGEKYVIENCNVEKPLIDFVERKIKVNTGNSKHRSMIMTWLKNILKERSKAIIKEYSEKTGFQPNRITIRRQTTKWGSCSNKRNISLNLKLICLPEKVIKYVIYHEVTHLKYRKHGPAFWESIGKEFPDYEHLEKKLLEYWFYTEKLFENIGFREQASSKIDLRSVI
jgi:predicted metal-dependent hydrolase